MQIISAAGIDAARLHAAFTQAFADYLLGPFNLPAAQWPAFLSRQSVDLEASRVAMLRGDIAAFAFVAKRPAIRRWRLATMGALPAARGSGVAASLLEDFIARACQEGMERVELECFAQNDRALRLYRSRGFEVVHELFGYGPPQPADARAESSAVASEEIFEVTRDEAMQWLAAATLSIPDLPLQVTDESLRASPAPLQAWRCGQAQLVFSCSGPGIAVHSLIDPDMRQAGASALVSKLRADKPRMGINVPQLQRRDLGGAALESLGFTKLPLHQVLMQRRC